MTAAIIYPEASISITILFSGSKHTSISASVNLLLSSLRAALASVLIVNGRPFFIITVRGEAIREYPLMNLQ